MNKNAKAFYHKNTHINSKRLKEVLNVFYKNDLGYYLKYFNLSSKINVKLPSKTGEHLRKSFEKLGGGFIKFGQMLSLRYDLLDLHLCEELSKIKDKGDPLNKKEIEKIKDIQLSNSTNFDLKKRIFSGSYYDIYEGNWKGKKALVKIKKNITEDIEIIEYLLKKIEYNFKIKLDFFEMFKDFLENDFYNISDKTFTSDILIIPYDKLPYDKLSYDKLNRKLKDRKIIYDDFKENVSKGILKIYYPDNIYFSEKEIKFLNEYSMIISKKNVKLIYGLYHSIIKRDGDQAIKYLFSLGKVTAATDVNSIRSFVYYEMDKYKDYHDNVICKILDICKKYKMKISKELGMYAFMSYFIDKTYGHKKLSNQSIYEISYVRDKNYIGKAVAIIVLIVGASFLLGIGPKFFGMPVFSSIGLISAGITAILLMIEVISDGF